MGVRAQMKLITTHVLALIFTMVEIAKFVRIFQ
jgi:hypothetical protein